MNWWVNARDKLQDWWHVFCSVLTGEIVTGQQFDREHQREYSIIVTATDWAEEPLIGICQLTIEILDENDNNPKFENLRYECKSCSIFHIQMQLQHFSNTNQH